MIKKRGNPNWGKPDMNAIRNAEPTSFEGVVKELQLSPSEYVRSAPLKAWVRQNKDHKYVPSDLLQAWGFEVKGDA